MAIQDFISAGLGGLGVVVAGIATERGILLFRTRADVPRLRADLGSALGQGDLFAARMCVVTCPSTEANILAAGLAALPRGPAAVEERMASEARMTVLALERGVALLAIVAFVTPLLGLLGTVLGLLRVFHADTCTDLQVIEVRGTLAATALGFVIAIPAAALFVTFRRRIAARIARAEALGRYMLSFVKDERGLFAKEAV